jgi:hypothetical protein
MTLMKRFPTFLFCGALSACATMTGGDRQFISVTTTPPGAHCKLNNAAARRALLRAH